MLIAVVKVLDNMERISICGRVIARLKFVDECISLNGDPSLDLSTANPWIFFGLGDNRELYRSFFLSRKGTVPQDKLEVQVVKRGAQIVDNLPYDRGNLAGNLRPTNSESNFVFRVAGDPNGDIDILQTRVNTGLKLVDALIGPLNLSPSPIERM